MLTKRTAISLEEAQNKLLNVHLPIGIEEIPIKNADHRVVAEDIKSPFDYPTFRRSGYDGYAIRLEDDHDYPKEFKVVANIPAGATYDKPLQENEAARIMTGAFVPDGAGKVIMLEQTEYISDEKVKIITNSRHDNISPIGDEFTKDQIIIPKDTELNAGGISIMAAVGKNTVNVYKKPKVALITTGSELLQPNESIQNGKIFNSNGPLLEHLIEDAGGIVTESIQLKDDLELLQKNLLRLEKNNDIIITDGGVSVGDFDFSATTALNSDNLLFNKIKMRPGSVNTAFINNDTLYFALSGNPGACFTGFYFFVEPVLRRFVHQPSRLIKVKGILDQPYNKTNNFDRILRGQYLIRNNNYYVHLNGSDKSGSLGNLQSSTCLFKIPNSKEPIKTNSQVDVWLLP